MDLFTGLREEELYYIHDRETCYKELGCKCNNLHSINIDRNTGITIIDEVPLLKRQLTRFNYNTLGGLVKGFIAGKITQVKEDQQIELIQ